MRSIDWWRSRWKTGSLLNTNEFRPETRRLREIPEHANEVLAFTIGNVIKSLKASSSPLIGCRIG